MSRVRISSPALLSSRCHPLTTACFLDEREKLRHRLATATVLLTRQDTFPPGTDSGFRCVVYNWRACSSLRLRTSRLAPQGVSTFTLLSGGGGRKWTAVRPPNHRLPTLRLSSPGQCRLLAGRDSDVNTPLCVVCILVFRRSWHAISGIMNR